RYALLICAGHDEYWSTAMRRNVEAFIAAGGNAAFFSGNTCWWHVVFDDAFTFRRTGTWSDSHGLNDPEDGLTGTSFRNGGERYADGQPKPVGYTVQNAGHWVYSGTGLTDGDIFGADPGWYLIGYECDGAWFDWTTGTPFHPSGTDGTPRDFLILA